MFVHMDLVTGNISSTTFDSVAAALRAFFAGDDALRDSIPERVRQRIEIAIDLYALAVEQLTLDRVHLFNVLTNAAVSSAQLALEMSLKLAMPPTSSGQHDREDLRTLGYLMKEAKKVGLLKTDGAWNTYWEHVLQDRNDLTHGHREGEQYGVVSWSYMMVMFQTINRLAAEGRI